MMPAAGSELGSLPLAVAVGCGRAAQSRLDCVDGTVEHRAAAAGQGQGCAWRGSLPCKARPLAPAAG